MHKTRYSLLWKNSESEQCALPLWYMYFFNISLLSLAYNDFRLWNEIEILRFSYYTKDFTCPAKLPASKTTSIVCKEWLKKENDSSRLEFVHFLIPSSPEGGKREGIPQTANSKRRLDERWWTADEHQMNPFLEPISEEMRLTCINPAQHVSFDGEPHNKQLLQLEISAELYWPEALLETVSRVVTPSVVLPATESTSMKKETQEMTTIRMVGM